MESLLWCQTKHYLKGSVQHWVTSEIQVLRKEALHVFTLVIYVRIGKWPKDKIIITAFI